jgi:hypothetical protein
LFPAAMYYGDIVQILFVAVSLVLVFVSANAYRRRQEGRYLLLMLAFVFLCVVASDTAFFELYTGAEPAVIQVALLYVNPSLEILMVVCFLLAVVWSRGVRKRVIVTALAAILIIGVAASISYEYGAAGDPSAMVQNPLPAWCAKPAGGFLIVASSLGYNDSIGHGAPSASWPVLDVAAGANVSITVCNLYSFPVGFQIVHYLDNRLESVEPGRTMEVNFVADEIGVFFIYCSVFNPIHIFLQSGTVVVS